MNRIILLNNDNSLYLTGNNTYVISKIGTIYEISKVDDHCDIIGWGKTLSECSEIIVEHEKSVREGLCILC